MAETTSSSSKSSSVNKSTELPTAALTIRNDGKDYHCYIGHSRANYALAEALNKEDHHNSGSCQNNNKAESVHIVIDNGQRNLRDPTAFGVFLQAVANLPHVTEVSITINHAHQLPAFVLTKFLHDMSHLTILKLRDIEVTDSPYALAEVLQNHPSLHTVHLLGCHCRPVHVLIEALSVMRNLREVRLDGALLRQQCDVDARAALTLLCQTSSSSSST